MIPLCIYGLIKCTNTEFITDKIYYKNCYLVPYLYLFIFISKKILGHTELNSCGNPEVIFCTTCWYWYTYKNSRL